MSSEWAILKKWYPGVEIQAGADLQENCRFDTGCQIGSGAVIGQGVVVCAGARISGAVVIEGEVNVRENVTLVGPLHVGKNVFFAPGVTVGLVRAGGAAPDALTDIQEGAVIGKQAEILGGVCVGQYAHIRAKSRVIGDVPARTVVSRSPAIMEGYICKDCAGLIYPTTLGAGSALRLQCPRCATPAVTIVRDEMKRLSHVLLPNGACGPYVNMAGDDLRWKEDLEIR